VGVLFSSPTVLSEVVNLFQISICHENMASVDWNVSPSMSL